MDQERLGQFYQSKVWRSEQYPYLIKQLLSQNGLQRTFTPTELCSDIVNKLSEYINLPDSQIAVLFNLEFVDTLVRVYKVDPSNITYFADSENEARAARKWYKVECPNELIAWDADKKRIIMPNIKKKFDVVVMNPPYQPPVSNEGKEGSSSRGHTIWEEFVDLSLGLVHNGGYISAVHPNRWRKPEDKTFSKMTAQNILHLEMHSKKDGLRIFGAATPFDWYVMQKSSYKGKTTIKGNDEKREEIDLRKFVFLPNCEIQKVASLLASPKEEKCNLLYDSSAYHSSKPWMNFEKKGDFKHPCIYTTGKKQVRFSFSSKKNGLFGISKVIFGDSDVIANAVNDFDGEYGMSQHAMAIPTTSREEGEEIKKALESKEFNDLLQKALRWSQFQIDYKLFRHFRKDFWKDFI